MVNLPGGGRPWAKPRTQPYLSQGLIVSGSTAASMYGIPIIADTISIEEGGVLTHMATTALTTYSLRVITKDAFTIDETSAVDVSGQGYLMGPEQRQRHRRRRWEFFQRQLWRAGNRHLTRECLWKQGNAG